MKFAQNAVLADVPLLGAGPGLDGSSFMAVQQWQHDLDAFEAMSPLAQDHMIGRRCGDNEELDDAPESAHVKRTAQESFHPEAFVLRRMLELDDGVVNALFDISQPIRSTYFGCPPMRAGQLDLRQLGL